jgi:hypothetical protein
VNGDKEIMGGNGLSVKHLKGILKNGYAKSPQQNVL